jgi:two-component system cell cycle response regulator
MERSDYETTRAVARKGGVDPRSAEHPYLIGIAGEHAGRVIPLEGLRELTIGRTADCEIFIAVDDLVSRRHARVDVDEAGRAWLADLDSTNGTLLNGREVSRPALLRRGDRVFVGEATIFKFDFLSDEELDRWQSALVDALTECYNRAHFDHKLQELFELSKSRGRTLSVVMLDVDHFKSFNDQHGHQAGDFVLQQVGGIANAYLEGQPLEGSVFRYGGEEFVVLLPGCELDDARRFAEGLRATLEGKAFEFEGVPLKVTASLGVATAGPGTFETPESLVKQADDNLYRAKREGRNRVVAG